MDPIDRTFLAQTGRLCRAVVTASGLPRAGTKPDVLGMSVWVVRHELREFCTSVERLAWAKASGCPWVARTCSYAAGGGWLEVLQWARVHDCPWDERTCEMGRSVGAPWCPEVGAGAPLPVESGKDVCIRRVRWAAGGTAVGTGARVPLGHRDVLSAAAGGHLDMLRWAREHGCPWNKWQCTEASGFLYDRQTLAWVLSQPR